MRCGWQWNQHQSLGCASQAIESIAAFLAKAALIAELHIVYPISIPIHICKTNEKKHKEIRMMTVITLTIVIILNHLTSSWQVVGVVCVIVKRFSKVTYIECMHTSKARIIVDDKRTEERSRQWSAVAFTTCIGNSSISKLSLLGYKEIWMHTIIFRTIYACML